jgi:hypothetical protein
MLAKKLLKNEKGIAVVEMIPIIVIVLMLLSFSLGFFGVIHTGILNSMAARNYAFETFNHRTDLGYFRSDIPGDIDTAYHDFQSRVHAIASDKRSRSSKDSQVTSRDITIGWNVTETEYVSEGSEQYHNQEVYNVRDGFRYTNEGVNPVWIQTSYGICLNSICGEN